MGWGQQTLAKIILNHALPGSWSLQLSLTVISFLINSNSDTGRLHGKIYYRPVSDQFTDQQKAQ